MLFNGEKFDGYEFAAGSMFGLRSWQLIGTVLTGLTFQYPWKAGENTAVHIARHSAYWWECLSCNKMLGDTGYYMTTFHECMRSKFGTEQITRHVAEAWQKRDHQAGGLNCTCGFYAYTDITDLYREIHPSIHVAGIIEGYGLTTIGTKGFRSEKAVIRALVSYPEQPHYRVTHPLSRLELLGSYYNVPVMSLEEALEKFPLGEQTLIS